MKRFSFVAFAVSLAIPLSAFAASSSCVDLTRSLTLNSTGTDVTALQQFLAVNVGYTGTISGHAGSATVAAIQQYQKAKRIVSSGTPSTTGYGATGPKTRAAMACAKVVVAMPSPASAPATSTLIQALLAQLKILQDRIAALTISTPTPIVVQSPVANSTTPTSCSWNGQSVLSGSSITAYQSASVPFGQACSSQQRACTNGTLSGSYANASCTAGSAPLPPHFRILVNINQLDPVSAAGAARFAADGVWAILENSPQGINWMQTLSILNSSSWTVAENNPGDMKETDRVANVIGRAADGDMQYNEPLGDALSDQQIATYGAHVIPGQGTVAGHLIVMSRSYAQGDDRKTELDNALLNPSVAGAAFEFNPGSFLPDFGLGEGCAHVLSLHKKCYLDMPPDFNTTNYTADVQRAMSYFSQFGILNNPDLFVVVAAYSLDPQTSVPFLKQSPSDTNSIESAVVWLKSYQNGASIPPPPPQPFTPSVYALGSFDGSGVSDIPIVSGPTVKLRVPGASTDATVGTLLPGWSVVGEGDFNKDGKSDLLLENDRQLAIWYLNGATVLPESGNISAPLQAGWSVAGVGDFDGNGYADILLENGSQLAVWFIRGLDVQPDSANVDSTLASGWAIAGIGDFNGDDRSDLLLENRAQLALWLMNGIHLLPASGTIGVQSAQVSGIGDFDGDGRADMLVQKSLGRLEVWLMNGTSVKATNVDNPLRPNEGWIVTATGDFNGDGRTDILLRNGTQLAIWNMNGLVTSGGVGSNIAPLPDAGWSIPSPQPKNWPAES